MKHLFPAYLLMLVLLAACSSKPADCVSLRGEIKGLGTDTLYLYGTDHFYDRVDTIPVKKGKFACTLPIDTMVAVRLLFSDGTEYPLYINKGNKVVVKGNSSQLHALNVTGNVFNEEMSTFRKELGGLATPTPDALAEKAEEFIKAHPASLVSIDLLRHYFVEQPQPNYTKIKRLTEQMAGELKDRPYIDMLLKQIQESEKFPIGRTLPYFSIPDEEGKMVNRTDFKDQYIWLHFWASWDKPSRQANAALRQLYQKEKKNPHFVLVGVSLDVDKQAWKEAIKQDSLEWKQLCDESGWNADLAKQLTIQTLPANLLVSANGRIEGKNLDVKAIENKLEAIEEEFKKRKEEEKARKRRLQKR